MRKPRLAAACTGLGAAIFAVAAVIELHAHGTWTYSRHFDEEAQIYVCAAEHPQYAIVGEDAHRSPVMDFNLGVDSSLADGGVWLWRVGFSAGERIRRGMRLRLEDADGTWRWSDVPWMLIDQTGGYGREFAIEWRKQGRRTAVTAIHFDAVMDAYDWVVACQSGGFPDVPLGNDQPPEPDPSDDE